MSNRRTLIALAAVVITIALLQTSLVFACDGNGGGNGGGNGNGNGDPGGQCDRIAPQSRMPGELRPGCNGGPDAVTPPDL